MFVGIKLSQFYEKLYINVNRNGNKSRRNLMILSENSLRTENKAC